MPPRGVDDRFDTLAKLGDFASRYRILGVYCLLYARYRLALIEYRFAISAHYRISP